MSGRLLLIFSLVAFPVVGAADDDHLKARQLTEEGIILPLEQILNQTRLDHPGNILEVKLEQEHGQYVYEIELLDKEGRVWELEYNAATGELIELEQEK